MNILERAVGNASSFSGTRPPEPARVIGQIERSGGIFIYYQGESGQFYYITQSGLEFARRMEKAIKEKRTKK